MQQRSQPFDFSHLSVDERIDLAMALWDSVHEEVQKSPLLAWQEKELAFRLAEEKAGRVTYSAWEDVKKQIFPEL